MDVEVGVGSSAGLQGTVCSAGAAEVGSGMGWNETAAPASDSGSPAAAMAIDPAPPSQPRAHASTGGAPPAPPHPEATALGAAAMGSTGVAQGRPWFVHPHAPAYLTSADPFHLAKLTAVINALHADFPNVGLPRHCGEAVAVYCEDLQRHYAALLQLGGFHCPPPETLDLILSTVAQKMLNPPNRAGSGAAAGQPQGDATRGSRDTVAAPAMASTAAVALPPKPSRLQKRSSAPGPKRTQSAPTMARQAPKASRPPTLKRSKSVPTTLPTAPPASRPAPVGAPAPTAAAGGATAGAPPAHGCAGWTRAARRRQSEEAPEERVKSAVRRKFLQKYAQSNHSEPRSASGGQSGGGEEKGCGLGVNPTNLPPTQLQPPAAQVGGCASPHAASLPPSDHPSGDAKTCSVQGPCELDPTPSPPPAAAGIEAVAASHPLGTATSGGDKGAPARKRPAPNALVTSRAVAWKEVVIREKLRLLPTRQAVDEFERAVAEEFPEPVLELPNGMAAALVCPGRRSTDPRSLLYMMNRGHGHHCTVKSPFKFEVLEGGKHVLVTASALRCVPSLSPA